MQKAQCLCGAVKLQVKHNNRVHACHCGKCRTWSGGAAFVLEAEVAPEIEGGGSIARYPSSEWADRVFCKQCGTHLFVQAQGAYYVNAGLFADQQNLALSAQIFVDCKAPYYELANDTPKMTEKEFLASIGME